MQLTKKRRNVTVGAAAIALLAAIPLITVLTSNTAQAANAVPGDGTTAATAGASCWGIKQAFPASTDGVYWLNTVALERPTEFYCDMTTDGGGWVLIGRGREGWRFSNFGQGSPKTLRTTPDGTAAFSPAALPASDVNALLNGQAVNTLTDGIRVERATKSDGKSTQDVRLYPKYTAWAWNFDASQLLDHIVLDGKSYAGSNTGDTASDAAYGQTTNQLSGQSGTKRMFTTAWSGHNNQKGFSFGSGISGSSSSTNYLWSYAKEGNAIPFSQVFIRPRIANDAAGFTPIPATGYPAEPQPAALKNRSELANWGVVGIDHTAETNAEPWNTNVLTLRVAGDRTFVGGRFTGVQQGPAASPVDQPYLAAFSIDGNFIDTFRPQLDGRVWDMIVTPDNKLIIAGDFTEVNGNTDAAGLAALDPTTGQLISGWKARVTNADGSRAVVRALAQHDGWIYAGGKFNRVQGGNWGTIKVTNAVNLSSSTGSPGLWRPQPNSSVVRMTVTNDGTRVLLSGYFSTVNGDANQGYFGIVDSTGGANISGLGPWQPSVGANAKYQQAVADLGDRILVGGSEHDFQMYTPDRKTLLDSTITKQGGDTQAITVIGGKVYFSCHCGNWVYEGTNDWTSPTGFRAIAPINLVAAVDPSATSLNVDTNFWPSSLKGTKGEGIWAIDGDSRGCLWVGGDLIRGAYSGNAATDWLGGFARFCPEDTTPPTTPTNLSQTASGSGVQLTWGASTDTSGAVSYDVYRDDRVIASVWGTSYTDPEVSGSHRYTVRAVDARGNRSASPAPVNVAGPSPAIATPLAFGATWRYDDSGADIGNAWRSPSFDDSAWATGKAKLGWGRTDLATTIGASKPLTVRFRTSISVTDASAVRTMPIQLTEATGAVAYVNGVEAGRINMPAGAITSTTPASSYIWGSAETSIKTLTIPGSLLHNGTNEIAVEVHNVTAGASRLFFDASATLYGTGGDATAPTAPNATAIVGTNQVTVNWTPSTDDTTLAGYLIRRDGAPVAVAGPTDTSFVDGEVDTTVAHTYTVTAFDANGNATSSADAHVDGVADPNLMSYGTTWKWFYAEGGPTADWASTTFDDSSWASGPAEFGYGDNDEATLISTSPAPRPLTSYYRTTITVPNPSAFTSVLANLIRDDGAVVYVNGVEVGRDNMPSGPISFSTPASSIISNRTQEKTPVQITIPSSAFVAGTNVIAVEIHNSDRWSGDMSMDLKLTGQP